MPAIWFDGYMVVFAAFGVCLVCQVHVHACVSALIMHNSETVPTNLSSPFPHPLFLRLRCPAGGRWCAGV